MDKHSLRTGIFRITFPIVFGIMAYILVLVFFGSALQILDNFFSQEALLCIGIAFLLEESLLLMHRLAFKSKFINYRLFNYALILLSTFVALVIVTLVISLYFTWVLNLTNFKRELLIFNAIYGTSAILYCVVWISIYFIQKQNKHLLQKEKLIETNLQQEFKNLIYNTEPELFYLTLEEILTLLKTNPELADEYLAKLSSFYRNKLETKNQEYVKLSTELKTVDLLKDLLNLKHHKQIKIQKEVQNSSSFFIKPLSVVECVKKIENQSIINTRQTLGIQLYNERDKLYLKYENYQKLDRTPSKEKSYISDLQNCNEQILSFNLKKKDK